MKITIPCEGQIELEHPEKGKFRLLCPSCDNNAELYMTDLKYDDTTYTRWSQVTCGVCGITFRLNEGTTEAIT